MSKISETKLKTYVNKLYRGDLSRYKKKNEWEHSIKKFLAFEEKKIKRQSPTKPQQKRCIEDYHSKCAICGLPYTSYGFEYHHIDGDRSKARTVRKNLVLLCKICHSKVTNQAQAKLRDYINKQPKPTSPFSIKMPKYKPPKFKF